MESHKRLIRVLLADRHTITLQAIGKLLEDECRIVGTATDGLRAVELAARLKPDIAIFETDLPTLSGIQAGGRATAAHPALKLIFLTEKSNPDTIAGAFGSGASGYLLKTGTGRELRFAIRHVLAGHEYVTPEIADEKYDSLDDIKPTKSSGTLTVRQREVLSLLGEGATMREISGALEISPRTVAFHKYKLMEELRFSTNAQLLQFAGSLA